jgi:hypothetical protein
MCAQRAPKTAVFDFDTDIDPASPLVTDVTPAADGSYVDVAFSKYMLASTLTGSTITVSNRVGGATGDTVEGSISAVNPVLVGGVQRMRRTWSGAPPTGSMPASASSSGGRSFQAASGRRSPLPGVLSATPAS